MAEKEDVKFADAVILVKMAPPFQKICYGHIKQLALKCKFHTAKSEEGLIKDLVTIIDSFDNLKGLKTDLDTYHLF